MLTVKQRSEEIDIERCADLLEESVVLSSFDLGSAIAHEVEHGIYGRCVLVSTVCGRAAMLTNRM